MTSPQPLTDDGIKNFREVYEKTDPGTQFGREYIGMLLATIAHLQSRLLGEWRPIESAPKDERILVGPTKRMGICVAMNHSRDGWVTEQPCDWTGIYTPKHWQPLPPPPSSQETPNK